MTPTCPECGGSGEIVLLTSRRPCKACAARKAEGATAVPVTYTFNVTLGTIEADLAAVAGKVNAGPWPVAPP